ncbi:MAG: aminotransferase class V-fold PLP-dependent enzyme [Bryobacterales bacterium]|nr:aminotransferase class V-fold PLP-dependent enzyme [Bryobacterales bacterium]
MHDRLPLDMSGEEFRRLGYRLVDLLAEFVDELRDVDLTPGESPAEVRAALGSAPLPSSGAPAAQVLEEAWRLLRGHSLFSGHPRFAGYVISSAAPLGALADLMAAGLNPNVGAWKLSPMATEMELQAVRWIAELLGFPADCDGLLVSGGNMANFIGFLAARGREPRQRLRVYASRETHTWLEKAADLFGDVAVRSIGVDEVYRMDCSELERRIAQDKAEGETPFLIVASAGTVSTGAVDPLARLRQIADANGLWLHVDGAYGAPAAALDEASEDLRAVGSADSIAVDPHKWLYTPVEAGCVLVRRPGALRATFDHSPVYYRFEEDGAPVNFYQLGLQNSRGFRALKVWMQMKCAGREGLLRMIGHDMAMARLFASLVLAEPQLELMASGLSIVVFRFLGNGVVSEDELNRANAALLDRVQASGELFLSNAVLEGRFALRMCFVNFRTTEEDVRRMVADILRLGYA